MKSLEISEILDIPQLSIFMGSLDFPFFLINPKDLNHMLVIGNKYFQNILPIIDFKTYSFYDKEIETTLLSKSDEDAYSTAIWADIVIRTIEEEKKFISSQKLVLYLGFLANKYLTWINEAEQGKHEQRDEFCYKNGEIIVIENNKIVSNNPKFSIDELKHKLAEAIIISNNLLKSNKKNFSISGTYNSRGLRRYKVKENYSTNQLNAMANSHFIISNLNFEKFAEYIQTRLLSKYDVIKYIRDKKLPQDLAITLMSDNIISETEVLKKIFNAKNFSELAQSPILSLSAKLQLYSMGKIDIKTLEKTAIKHQDDGFLNESDFSNLVQYYKGNINKIAELLTHNVLDYTSSMKLLNYLTDNKAISLEHKNKLTQIMNDFKTKELLSKAPNNHIDRPNLILPPHIHTRGLTMNPKLREEYFQSIGNIKKIFINGHLLIKDDSENSSTKNSLDGYELLIFPDKGIAIMEKSYKVTRNSKGELEYQKDEKGNLIPAIENATYIMPIGMAKDFIEKKNKQQLIQSPYVERSFHTLNWVKNTESKIKSLNPAAQFDKENTEFWNKKISENYKKLTEAR